MHLQNENGRNGQENTVHMKREIGLFKAVCIALGTMIGSGIFVSPSGVLKETQSSLMSLCIWALCGIYTLLTALCYCELGTVVLRSGADHAYLMASYASLHSALGQLPAFLYIWTNTLVRNPQSHSILSLSLAQYVLSYGLSSSTCSESLQADASYRMSMKLLAVCFVALIAAMNCYSVKVATRFQVFFTSMTLLAMLIIIGIGFKNLVSGEYGQLTQGFEGTELTAGNLAISFQSGLWAYGGSRVLAGFCEELKNPRRTLPLATLIAVVIVTCLYLLVNVSYLTVLSKSEMIESSAVAVDLGNMTLGQFKWVFPLFIIVTITGSLNGGVFSSTRVAYVGAREGHLTEIISYVHCQRLTPVVAIIAQVVLSSPFIFWSNIGDLIQYFGFIGRFITVLSLIGLFVLRKRNPDAYRPFKVPLPIPIVCILISVYLLIAPLLKDPSPGYFYLLGYIGIGILVYYVFVIRQYKLLFTTTITKVIQKLTLTAPSPFKEE